MSMERRFAWMESMLDTTINCYEAHRDTLEMIYADLYRLHSESGCIHLSATEAEKMLRSIADVLEQHALKLPAFDDDDEATPAAAAADGRKASPATGQQQQQTGKQPAATGAARPAAQPAAATKSGAASTAPSEKRREGAPVPPLAPQQQQQQQAATPSMRSAASKRSGVPGAAGESPFLTPNEGPIPTDFRSEKQPDSRSLSQYEPAAASSVRPSSRQPSGENPSETGGYGGDDDAGSAKPAMSRATWTSAGIAPADEDASWRSPSTYSRGSGAAQKPLPPQAQTPQQVERPPSTHPSSRTPSAHPTDQNTSGQAPPPADLPTALHRTPSSSHNNSYTNRSRNESSFLLPHQPPPTPPQRLTQAPIPSEHASHRSTPASQVLQHQQQEQSQRPASASGSVSNRSTPAAHAMQQRQQQQLQQQRSEPAKSSQASAKVPSQHSATPSQRSGSAGSPGKPTNGSTPVPNTASSKSSSVKEVAPPPQAAARPAEEKSARSNASSRPATAASSNAPARGQPSSAQPKPKTPAPEDPLYNPYARPSDSRHPPPHPATAAAPAAAEEPNDLNVFPVRRESLSQSMTSQADARNTISLDNGNRTAADSGSRPKSGGDRSRASQPRSTAHSASASNHNNTISTPPNATKGQVNDTANSGNADADDEPDGMIHSVAARMGDSHHQEYSTPDPHGGDAAPEAAMAGSNAEASESPAPYEEEEDDDVEVEEMDMYGQPRPKRLVRQRPLRTTQPRRVVNNGNDSHQVEETVYKRCISPSKRGGPVLEDDPAVEAFMNNENAQLQERKQRQRREIASVPGCITDSQRKRVLALQYNGPAAGNDASHNGALIVAGTGNGVVAVANPAAAGTVALPSPQAKPLMTAAEDQLIRERQVLQNQLERMQQEWEITMRKMKESGNEPRYRQLHTRIERVRKDLARVDRELIVVRNIEAKRAASPSAPPRSPFKSG